MCVVTVKLSNVRVNRFRGREDKKEALTKWIGIVRCQRKQLIMVTCIEMAKEEEGVIEHELCRDQLFVVAQ